MRETEADWLATRLAVARSAQPVAEAVVLAIKTQMQGTMTQRGLRPGELDSLAMSLLSLANESQDRQAGR
jgi:hypothetical protein